jgi:hypothetical protein
LTRTSCSTSPPALPQEKRRWGDLRRHEGQARG